MEWYAYLVHFLGGAFLANGIPHFVQGASGNRFQSPFAKPPGIGLSSPVVNVFWGSANLVVGRVLIDLFRGDAPRLLEDYIVIGVGGFLMALVVAHSIGKARAAGNR